jgi:hypothetical protein
MFPSNEVMTWRPLLSTGSLRTMVPPLQRYYGTLRLPAVRLDPLKGFASRYHRVRPCVRSPRPGASHRGARELSVPVSPSGSLMETSGSLRFLENPDGHCPCSSTPVGPDAPYGTKCDAPDAAPACVQDEGSPRLVISGLNHTTFDLAVYASQDGSPHHHARLASGCWPSFARRDSYPQGSNERFLSSSLFLLSQAFLTQGHHTYFLGSGPGGPRGLLPQGSRRSVRALSGIRLLTS